MKLHRLEPSRLLRALTAAVSFIKDRRIVLSTGRSSLPMLAEAITGRPIRGSWMADREVYRIHGLFKKVHKHRDICAAPLARRLLDEVERTGRVRMDRWTAPTGQGRKARLQLERELLVVSRDLHTDRGYHTAIVMPWSWSRIARSFGARARRLDYSEAVDQVFMTAVRSAVIAPEREVRRWFMFGVERIGALVATGRLRRFQAGRITWLTCDQ